MEASVTGALRVLIIIVLLYYLFKILVRYLFPYLVKTFLNRAQKQFYEQNPHLDPEQKSNQKEGEIKVNKKAGKSPEKGDSEFGEYVDYEEINDKN